MTDFDTQRALQKNRVRRRGIYLLPNLFTTAALFFGFFAIQMLLPFYQWAKDPNFTTDTASGLVLFVSIVAAVFGFFIYNVPLAALNAIVELVQLCMNS